MCIILSRLFKRKHQLLRFLRSMSENGAFLLDDKVLTASEAHDKLLYGYAVFEHLARLYNVNITNYDPAFADINATINTSNIL